MESLFFFFRVLLTSTFDLKPLDNRMDKAVNKIGLLLNHANSDIRLKALHSVTELIQIITNPV